MVESLKDAAGMAKLFAMMEPPARLVDATRIRKEARVNLIPGQYMLLVVGTAQKEFHAEILALPQPRPAMLVLGVPVSQARKVVYLFFPTNE
jgi:hypothetical protein